MAIGLFVFTSVLALLVSMVFQQEGAVSSQSSGAGNLLYILWFMILTLAFSGAILYVARKKGMRVIRGLFIILSLFVIFIVALPISELLVTAQYYLINAYSDYEIYGIWFGIPVIMGYLLLFRQEWYVLNVLGMLLAVGLSAVWGIILNAWYSALLLAVFAVYDYIAVYRTKHMIELADASIKGGLPMLFMLPGRRGAKLADIREESTRKEGGVMLLGYGDIALPCVMVVSSASLGNFSLFPWFILPLAGAVAGMLVLFLSARRPAPGLPFINAGAIAGFLVSVLLSGYL